MRVDARRRANQSGARGGPATQAKWAESAVKLEKDFFPL